MSVITFIISFILICIVLFYIFHFLFPFLCFSRLYNFNNIYLIRFRIILSYKNRGPCFRVSD